MPALYQAGAARSTGAETMNDANQVKMGDAIVAAILAVGTVTPGDDVKTIIARYAQIHAALVKSGGVLAPGTLP
jgi:hypothetical protein